MYTQQSHIFVYNPNQTNVYSKNSCISEYNCIHTRYTLQTHVYTKPIHLHHVYSTNIFSMYTLMYILSHVFSTNQMIFNKPVYTHRHFHPCMITYTHVNTYTHPCIYTYTHVYRHVYTHVYTVTCKSRASPFITPHGSVLKNFPASGGELISCTTDKDTREECVDAIRTFPHSTAAIMDQENERNISRLWRTFRTVKEMVRDRGYFVTQEEIDMSLEDFKAKHLDSMGRPARKTMSFQANPTEEAVAKFPELGSMWVEFCDEASVGVKTMKTFVIHIQEKNYQTGIFVYQHSVTPSALKLVPSIPPATIETFHEASLIVNITHHELVPKHIRLSAAEKTELLKRYRLKESQLPRIQRADPVALYLGLKRGEVVKIIRKSETSGRYASYRICM